MAQSLQDAGGTPLTSYRVVLIEYAGIGALLALLFLGLSSSIEATTSSVSVKRRFGLHQSRNVVVNLSALFALDAFAGGFVVQSIIAYWFSIKFGVDIGQLGKIFFAANILAGLSALFAARITARSSGGAVTAL